MKRIGAVLIGGVALAGLVGCAGPSYLEQNWGTAQRENTSRMVANPGAGAGGADGLDAMTAEQAMDTYREGQVKRDNFPQAGSSVINIGAGSR